jgi:hypothetical protein
VNPADISACVAQMSRVLDAHDVGPGGLQHAIAQFQRLAEQIQAGWKTATQLEWPTGKTPVSATPGGPSVDVNRQVDVVVANLFSRIHTEIKTGKSLTEVLDPKQLRDDALIALRPALFGITQEVENVWRMTNIPRSPKSEAAIVEEMTALRNKLINELKFPASEVNAMLEKFKFQFAGEVNEKGETLFGPAMKLIFNPDGSLALAATKEAGGSPNFGPAMELVLGASGKMAKAATEAAGEVNLEPASEALEKKVEAGVTDALTEAGTKGADAAGGKLHEKISGGLTALGNIMTSIPQLYDSVTKLGEAWDKPNKSTKDYMDLLGAAGGVVTNVGGVIQAFAGITQIASAAQAVFNAIAAMNPYVLIAIAVIALIAAIVLLIVYWDQVKAAIRDNPWIAVIAVMFGVIGVIVLVIAYWDEIKLAALMAANFVSIQIQKMGMFFVGLGTLAGMVWDNITANVQNVGIAILNTFISAGGEIQNFFIGLINGLLSTYNEFASSTVGEALGLETADLIPPVDIKANLIPPKEVPEIDFKAAFPPTDQVTGGLEGQIKAQQDVVAKAQAEDSARQKKAAEDKAKAAATPPAGAPGAPGAVPGAPAGLPPLPGMPPAAAPALPPAAPAGLPALPGAPGAGPGGGPAAGGGPVDASVHVEGGITVNINADKLEADAAEFLSDEIINQISSRIGSLQSEAALRVGERAA